MVVRGRSRAGKPSQPDWWGLPVLDPPCEFTSFSGKLADQVPNRVTPYGHQTLARREIVMRQAPSPFGVVPTMNHRRLWVRGLLLTGLLVLVCEQIWRHGQDYIFAQRFVEVEPGKLYRGAWQHDLPMRRLMRDAHIKTVVALAHPPENPLVAKERALARELGVRWLHIPIVEATVDGEERTMLRSLEQAADALADPANQPVYFHCHHGLNRVSMVQMAYRMLHCGWTLDQATEEIAKTPSGLVEVRHGVDYRYMKNFYNQCVLPRRLAAGSADAKTPR